MFLNHNNLRQAGFALGLASTVACSGIEVDGRSRSAESGRPVPDSGSSGSDAGSEGDGLGSSSGSGTGPEQIEPIKEPANITGLFLAQCSADTSVSFVEDPALAESITACRISDPTGKDVAPEAIDEVEIKEKSGTARAAERIAKSTASPWTVGFKLPLEETGAVAEVRFAVKTDQGVVETTAKTFDFAWLTEGVFKSFVDDLLADLAMGIESTVYQRVIGGGGDNTPGEEGVAPGGSGGGTPQPGSTETPKVGNVEPGSKEEELPADAQLPPPLASDVRHAFASSEAFQADLGGTAGADAHCARLAKAASRAGVWRAFLGTTKIAAIERLALDGVPLHRVDEAKIVDDAKLLATGPLDRAIDRDERGRTLALPAVTNGVPQFVKLAWTGLPDANCGDWTSKDSAASAAFGDLTRATLGWSNAGLRSCARYLRLICISD